MKQQPVKEFRFGPLCTKVWPGRGRAGGQFTVTFARTIRGDSGWRLTSHFRREDLGTIAWLANCAKQWISRAALWRSDDATRTVQSKTFSPTISVSRPVRHPLVCVFKDTD